MRTCLICNTKYNYCPKCNPDLPTWYNLFDKEVCSVVYRTLSSYGVGTASKDDVKDVIKQYNLTDFGQFNDPIKEKLQEILKEQVDEKTPTATSYLKKKSKRLASKDSKPEVSDKRANIKEETTKVSDNEEIN